MPTTTATGKPLQGWASITTRRRGSIVDDWTVCPDCAAAAVEKERAAPAPNRLRGESVTIRENETAGEHWTCRQCEPFANVSDSWLAECGLTR